MFIKGFIINLVNVPSQKRKFYSLNITKSVLRIWSSILKLGFNCNRYFLSVLVIMKNVNVWSWRSQSLTIKSIKDGCCCLHGLKTGPENLPDNLIDLRNSFCDLQQDFPHLQKPDKASSLRIRLLKSFQIKDVEWMILSQTNILWANCGHLERKW